MNLAIRIEDGASPALLRAMRLVTDRASLHRAAGGAVQEEARAHIAALSRRPGSLADRAGAPASHFYARAAEKVAGAAALAADVSGAVLSLPSAGLSRAFGPVTIFPRSAKSLAIPIHPLAFGHRAAELWDRMGLFIPKGGRVVAAVLGGAFTPLYILCKSVTQKQDRSLLPTGEQFLAAAVRGAREHLLINE